MKRAFLYLNRRFLSLADVPSEVDSYHSLFPLEPLLPPNRMQKTGNFSYITSCYKAVNSKDDLPYCLRRIQGESAASEPGSCSDGQKHDTFTPMCCYLASALLFLLLPRPPTDVCLFSVQVSAWLTPSA